MCCRGMKYLFDGTNKLEPCLSSIRSKHILPILPSTSYKCKS